ncbi:hypothetical protein [Terracidiphilus sp.]|jgi:hypothetical protein|uniref:hypothetical protein n=1 Tax=Terracidiphilus sp. TaxID=1964191 RepID=UPI003C21D6BD
MKAYDQNTGDLVVNAAFPANGIPGEVISVRTDLGVQVHAWRPNPLPQNLLQCYFCHGYSLGTYAQFGYSIMSGQSLHQVLADEFFKVGTLGMGNLHVQQGDRIVWWKGLDAIHSAVVDHPVQNGNQLNVNQTRVSSKTGTGIVRINVPLATVNNDYNTANLREIYRRQP